MLTNDDLNKIEKLLESRLSSELSPIRKDISILKEDVAKIRKDISAMLDFFDREYLIHLDSLPSFAK